MIDLSSEIFARAIVRREQAEQNTAPSVCADAIGDHEVGDLQIRWRFAAFARSANFCLLIVSPFKPV
jgi:hypothetical protein